MTVAQLIVLSALVRDRGVVTLPPAQARSAEALVVSGHAQRHGYGRFSATKRGEDALRETLAALGYATSNTITAREARVLATARRQSMHPETPWTELDHVHAPNLTLRGLLEREPTPAFPSRPQYRITTAGLEAIEGFERSKADTAKPA